MARPRRHPDSTLIDAAAAAIAERGVSEWSLEDVAARTGMSPAALVKRFGSKRSLLLAVVTAWVELIPDPPAGGIADPLGMLVRQLRDDFAGLEAGTAPAHLGLLLAEIGDAEIRPLVREGWRRQEAIYAALLAAARRQGALRGPAPDRAGAMVMALAQGVALRWSVDPEGSLPEAQAQALSTLLDCWR